jgi:hypothetical protein
MANSSKTFDCGISFFSNVFRIAAVALLLGAAMVIPIAGFAQHDGSPRRGASSMVGKDLAVYPGATFAPENKMGSGRATVIVENAGVNEISASRYVSQDAPEKILNFYKSRLKSLGSVVQCDGGANRSVDVRLDEKAFSNPQACQADNLGTGETELKAGDEVHQHIVAVRPRGTGAEISLVHVYRR